MAFFFLRLSADDDDNVGTRVCCSEVLTKTFFCFPEVIQRWIPRRGGGVQCDRVVSWSDDRTNVVGVRRVVEGRSLEHSRAAIPQRGGD